MTRLLLLAALYLALALPQGAAAQGQFPIGAWTTIRVPEQGISIRMPPDWQQVPPWPQQDRNTKLVIRSTRAPGASRIGVATCTVTVVPQPETQRRTQASMNAQVQSGPLSHAYALNLFESFSTPQILESGLTRFSNLPAYLVVGRGFVEEQNLPMTSTSVVGVAIQPGRMLGVSCSVATLRNVDPDAAWASWEPVFTTILGTFLPED